MKTEKTLQKAVNQYLKITHYPYIRIPDEIYRVCFASKNVPAHLKKIIADHIAGLPDNIIAIPIGEKFFIGCAIELKSPKGKLSKKQKEYQKIFNTNVIRNIEGLIELLSELKQFVKGKGV